MFIRSLIIIYLYKFPWTDLNTINIKINFIFYNTNNFYFLIWYLMMILNQFLSVATLAPAL